MIYRTYENIGPNGSNPFTEHASLTDAQNATREDQYCSRTIEEFPERSGLAWISTGAEWYQANRDAAWMKVNEARPEA